jgi:hypothetical protein
MQVAVLAPGEYDISDYVLRWALPDADKQYSHAGAPFLLTVEDSV